MLPQKTHITASPTLNEELYRFGHDGNRIASKIGTGGFEKMTKLCTQDLTLTANANILLGNVLQQITDPTNRPNDEYPVDVCNGYYVATALLTNPLPDFYISNTALNFVQNNLLQRSGRTWQTLLNLFTTSTVTILALQVG